MASWRCSTRWRGTGRRCPWRRDRAREVLDHGVIENDLVGNHRGVHDAHLELVLGHGHDGVRRGLGTRAGGGGNHGALDLLLGELGVTQQVAHGVAGTGEYAHELGRVHHGTAADGEDAVRAALAIPVHNLLHLGIRGFDGQVGLDLHVDTAGLDNLESAVAQAQVEHDLLGEECHAGGSIGQDAVEAVHGVLAAEHGGRKLE